MRAAWGTGWFALAFAACSVPREEFPAAKANALCDLQKRCARGAFHAQWSEMKVCREKTEEDVAEAVADFDWCSYDALEGGRCAARVRALPCDDFALGRTEEACDLVFDCGFAR